MRTQVLMKRKKSKKKSEKKLHFLIDLRLKNLYNTYFRYNHLNFGYILVLYMYFKRLFI